MDTAAKSLVVVAVYLLPNAAGLAFTPNTVLGMFGLPATQEPWIRVLGHLGGGAPVNLVSLGGR